MASASSLSDAEKLNPPITDPPASNTPSSAAGAVAHSPSRLTLSSSSGSSSSSDDADHEANSGSSSGLNNRKKGGRGKVEMKKMEKESNLLVTFSKRKSGIFKKANEICILCGVQCAVIMFSPAGKVFSYGHPSVDHVVDRYLTGILNRSIHLDGTLWRPQNAAADDASAKLTYLMEAVEEAKKEGRRLDKMKEERVSGKGCKWGKAVEEMEGGELESLKRALGDLRSKIQIAEAARRLEMSFGSSSSGPGGYQWFRQSYLDRDAAGPSSNPVFSDFLADGLGNNRGTDQTGPGDRGIGGRGGSPFSA